MPRIQIQQSLHFSMSRSRFHSETKTLYHATELETAQEIVRSGTMIPSTKGMLGPGIYFAETMEGAKVKCRHKGAVLEMDVALGNPLVTDKAWSTLNEQVVRRCGFDSVKEIGFRTGTEYVVYSASRVFNIGIVHIWLYNKTSVSFRRWVPAEQETAMAIRIDYQKCEFITYSSRPAGWHFASLDLQFQDSPNGKIVSQCSVA
jgi:hypothetical protein